MNLKSSSDLWFSAFLQLKGIRVEKFEVISRGKGRYFFDLTDDQWNFYKLEFNNSDIVRYKISIEQLKDLLY